MSPHLCVIVFWVRAAVSLCCPLWSLGPAGNLECAPQLGRDIQLIHFLVSENGNAKLDTGHPAQGPQFPGSGVRCLVRVRRTSLGTFTIVTSTGQTLGAFHHKTVNHTGNQTILNFPMHQFKAKIQVTKIILSEDANRNSIILML